MKCIFCITSVINGILHEDVGGGLCQLSGLLYHLALLAGLEVGERHNHSLDIYTDETRYAPLGTDAAVVYGYKDLRLKNTLDGIISFYIEVGKTEVKARLNSDFPIKQQKLEFNSFQLDGKQKQVEIRVGEKLVSKSVYKE